MFVTKKRIQTYQFSFLDAKQEITNHYIGPNVLDFKTFKTNHLTVSNSSQLQEAEEGTLYIEELITKSKLKSYLHGYYSLYTC
jgi:hypothetical protein